MKTKQKKQKKQYSISVSGKTHTRLCVATVNVRKLVNGLITSMLDDPALLESMVTRCQPKELN